MILRLLVVLVLSIMACSTTPTASPALWDLSDGHDVARVGWPDLDTYSSDRDGLPEAILLPTGIKIDQEYSGVVGSRDAGSDQIRVLTLSYASESVQEVVARAERYAAIFANDPTRIQQWGRDNAVSTSRAPGGMLVRTPAVRLPGDLFVNLAAQTLNAPEVAHFRITLFWQPQN